MRLDMGRPENITAKTSSGVRNSLVDEVQIIWVLANGATQSLAPPRRCINHRWGGYSSPSKNSRRLGVAKWRRRITFLQPNRISVELGLIGKDRRWHCSRNVRGEHRSAMIPLSGFYATLSFRQRRQRSPAGGQALSDRRDRVRQAFAGCPMRARRRACRRRRGCEFSLKMSFFALRMS